MYLGTQTFFFIGSTGVKNKENVWVHTINIFREEVCSQNLITSSKDWTVLFPSFHVSGHQLPCLMAASSFHIWADFSGIFGEYFLSLTWQPARHLSPTLWPPALYSSLNRNLLNRLCPPPFCPPPDLFFTTACHLELYPGAFSHSP